MVITSVNNKQVTKLASINNIGYNTAFNGTRLYTKRTCSDNSELFINYKLDTLYKQAISGRNSHVCRRNLRKLVEDNHLDEIV